MELLDHVDMNGTVISTKTKDAWRKEYFNHKSALIIPHTKDGKLLLAKRSATKQPFPGVWVCGVGGTCASGESFEATAYREMREEIGLEAQLRTVSTFHYKGPQMQAIFRVFTTTDPLDEKTLTLDEEEIQYVQAFEANELRRMIRDEPEQFAPTAIAAIQHFLLAHLD